MMKLKFEKSIWTRLSVLFFMIGLMTLSSYAGVKEDLIEAAQVMTLRKLGALEDGVILLAEENFDDPAQFVELTVDQMDQIKQEVLLKVFEELDRCGVIETFTAKICANDPSSESLQASLHSCFTQKSAALISLSQFIDQQFLNQRWESQSFFQTLKESLKENPSLR